MARIKTSELTGAALRWAVATAEGIPFTIRHGEHIAVNEREFDPEGPAWEYDLQGWKMWDYFRPDEVWDQGGPIIDREGICWNPEHGHASRRVYVKEKDWWVRFYGYGPTPLIAAMRCHVASHLGEEVEIPEELV